MHRAVSPTIFDATPFWLDLAAGALDACLLRLRSVATATTPEPMANCRLAEALLHAGRAEEAVECCRRALSGAPHDSTMLRICAWVFSNGDCHDEAAAAYRSLIEQDPAWTDGHRHLSGSLAAAGRIEDAIAAALTACGLAPGNAEFALHAGALLLANGRRDEALLYAERAAVSAAGDTRLLTDAGELLMRCDRADTAADLLVDLADASDDPRVARVLSAAEMMCGRSEAALIAIECALSGAPDNAEYHLHRGHVLWRLGDLAGAAVAFDRAAALDAASREVTQAQMSLYAATGRLHEATAAGGELLHRFPDDRNSAEAVLHLLNHRLDTIDGDYVVIGHAERALRPPRPRPGMLARLRSQRRVVRALIIRETRTRFAEFRLGYGWALIEPILHIALLSAMFAVLMHGRPPIGRHFFLFYYTGLVRYSGADGTSERMI